METASCSTDPASQGRGHCSAEPVDRKSAVDREDLLLQVGKPSLLREERHVHARVNVSEVAGEQSTCYGMPDVKRRCSADGCKVLATNMHGRSCGSYCGSRGFACVAAWEEVNNDCKVKERLTCQDSSLPTSDLICHCAPQGSRLLAAVVPPVTLSTFFWNVHWECSFAAKGASRDCKHRIGHRFVELARNVDAQVVASVELSDSATKPASLIGYGLTGWTQVDGPCGYDDHGDTAALAFAPGWHVQKSGGGCLRSDWDTRAFAVARVVPPSPVKGCPSLCFVAIHAPHSSITQGRDVVSRVCGDALEGCVVAMGDWNVPSDGVGGLWSNLIGNALPPSARPNVRTCCFPETNHYGVFDHIATNIVDSMHEGQKVHPYQILEENPVKQHRPVSARLLLPSVDTETLTVHEE